MSKVDPKHLGRVFDDAEYGPVSADELIAYSRSLGESAAHYVEAGPELSGHPTYCVRFRSRKGFPEDFPTHLLGRMSFDAGKDIQFGTPIRPGDMVRVVSTVHEVYEKTGRTGTMTFVVVRFAMTNQRGEHLATIDNRMMFRP